VREGVLLREAVEDIHELGEPLGLLRVSLHDAVGDASLHVEFEDGEADAVERRLRGGQLLQDVDAKPRLLHHPAYSPNLTFDSIQPGHDRLLLWLVEHAFSLSE